MRERQGAGSHRLKAAEDVVHPTGQTNREWANAVLPVVLYLQANL